LPPHLTVLRRMGLAWWKKNLRREFELSIPCGIQALKRKRKKDKSVCAGPERIYAWTLNGRQEYHNWFKTRWGLAGPDLEAGGDAIRRAWRSSWWEWEDGFRPFYWRWRKWYRKRIRDGLEVFFLGTTPKYHRAQRASKDPGVKEKEKKKLGSKVRKRRHITPGYVVSLTSFFSVPKGEFDI
jgi:hypothetical protein